MTNPNILAIVAAVLYVGAAVVLLLSLTRTNSEASEGKSPSKGRSTLILAASAAVFHTFVALHQTGLPQNLQLPILVSMNVAALFIVTLLLIICLRQQAHYMGLAVYPISALLLLLSAATQTPSTALPLNIQLHVLLSLVAYAFLALAAVQAILVWVQREKLQHHKPGGILRSLPALDSTERLLFTLLFAGFATLSLSLATGFFYLEDLFAQHLVHKSVLSVLAWLIFGLLLFARWRWGWRGKRAVFWTLIGFAVLILAYFGSKFVLEIVLNRN